MEHHSLEIHAKEGGMDVSDIWLAVLLDTETFPDPMGDHFSLIIGLERNNKS